MKRLKRTINIFAVLSLFIFLTALIISFLDLSDLINEIDKINKYGVNVKMGFREVFKIFLPSTILLIITIVLYSFVDYFNEL